MKYYKDNQSNVFAYELDGSQDHLIGDKVAMTVEEIELHINPPKVVDLVTEAKAYILATDYMMTVDYDKDTTEVRILRQQARDTIRGASLRIGGVNVGTTTFNGHAGADKFNNTYASSITITEIAQ